MYAPQHFAKRCWNAQLVHEANSASARICLPLNLIQCVLDACEKSNSIHDVITRAIWLCDQISAHGNHLSRAASHKQVLIPFSRLGTLIICDSKNQQRVREEHQHQTPREVYWGSRLLLITPPPIHGAVLHSIYINIFAGDFWSKYNKRARRERDRAGHQRRNLPACSPIFMAGAARESAPPQPPADTRLSLSLLHVFPPIAADAVSGLRRVENWLRGCLRVDMHCLLFRREH